VRLGGDTIGPNPTDRGKLGCKYNLLTDGQGTLLVTDLNAANVNDGTMLLALIDATARRESGPILERNEQPEQPHEATNIRGNKVNR